MVVVLHNVCGLLLGYALAGALRLPPAKARAVGIEVGMQNSGLAASLAILYFNPAAAIPGAIFSVWHNISGSLAANYFSRKDESMYNDEVIIPALENRGVNLKDARNYCIIGCVEPQAPHKTEGWHVPALPGSLRSSLHRLFAGTSTRKVRYNSHCTSGVE